MKCMTECFIASAFIGAGVYMMFTESNSDFNKLYDSLSEEKKLAFRY